MDETSKSLHLRLLDHFSLEHGVESIPLTKSAQRLLAYLGLQRRATRERLCGSLWPDSAEVRARASLRTILWSLNRSAPGAVTARGDEICLGESVELDLEVACIRARTILDESLDSDFLRECSDPLTFLPGAELLPGWTDEWVEVERERLRQLRMHALEALSSGFLHVGRYAAALECALEVTRMEPLRESGVSAVVAVHLAENNVVEANRHMRSYRQRLKDELGIRPSVDFENGAASGFGTVNRPGVGRDAP